MAEYQPLSYEAFPESLAKSIGMKILVANRDAVSVQTHLNVEYANKDGIALHLQIMHPKQTEESKKRWPLIVYVQGSSWQKQNLGSEIVQLGQMAKRGYVIAIVEYRHGPDYAFPTHIKDANSAVRWLINHAEEYPIDGDNIILWGTSSGAHTVLFQNIANDEQQFSDEDVEAFPLDYKACIDYYGPIDLYRMAEEAATQGADKHEILKLLLGEHEENKGKELAFVTNPLNHLASDKKVAPIFIVHGSKDRTVPFEESVTLYERLMEENREVEFYKLRLADHGGAAFWTEEMLNLVETFMKKCCQKETEEYQIL